MSILIAFVGRINIIFVHTKLKQALLHREPAKLVSLRNVLGSKSWTGCLTSPSTTISGRVFEHESY